MKMAEGYKKGGLEKSRYLVRKLRTCTICNGKGCQKCYRTGKEIKPIDPNAQYFVLRLDKDRHARNAALAYADSVETDNPELSLDIKKWVYAVFAEISNSTDNKVGE